MRPIRSYTLLAVALLALTLLVLASGSAAATVVPSTPGAGSSEGSSATGGSGVGQNPQLSKLTGEQTPEEQQEELAEKNAATVKSTESKPISTGLLALIGIVAAALIGGIAFFIMRDARSYAPATGLPDSGSARDRAARQRKRRNRAKAARQARKRNR
jgi:hypothetical protein